jgi:hypothetical protein
MRSSVPAERMLEPRPLRFLLSGGLHWEEIDEDISVPGLLLGYKDRTDYRNQI